MIGKVTKVPGHASPLNDVCRLALKYGVHYGPAMTFPEHLISQNFERHAAALAATREACLPAIEAMLDAWVSAIQRGGKIMLFGNGGSASDAQHLATELAVRYCHERKAIAAIALNTDTSGLTAAGNDLGFDQVFSRQIEALGKPGDVAVGISTSGKSANVVKALRTAKEMGLIAAGLTGCGGGTLVEIADPLIIVPVDETARIQEMHILIGHILCDGLENRLGLLHND